STCAGTSGPCADAGYDRARAPDREMNFDRLAPRLITALVVAVSAFGLLSMPIGDYDDSLLLMGARLTGVGSIPYVDFYSHYGPFGFTLLSTLTHVFGSPGLALRVGEIVLLVAIAALIHVLYRSLQANSRFGEYAVPLAVGLFSQAAMQPAFFGLAFATIGLGLFVLARTAPAAVPAALTVVVGGALLAVCALIRPAFAAYIAAAVVILEVAAGRPQFGALRASAPALLLFFGSAALAGAAAWILLYRRIPPTVALDATVFAPARLMGSGGARYLQPDFLELGGNLLAGPP